MIKRIVLLFLFGLFNGLLHCQYLNQIFNNSVNAESSSNLEISEEIEMFGVRNYGNEQFVFRKNVNSEGIQVSETELYFENFQFTLTQWAETFIQLESGSYVFCGVYYDGLGGTFVAQVSEEFDNVDWIYVLENPNEDQQIEIESFIQNSSNGFSVAGKVYYDVDEDPWSEYATLIYFELDENGDELIFEENNIYDDQYVRTSQVFETLNDTTILIGAVMHDWDNAIWKLNSTGEVIDSFEWGTEDYDEWLPWAVDLGNGTLAVAYQTGTDESFDFTYRYPSLMFFDVENMEPVMVKDFENHNDLYSHIHDLVQTPDGGFAIMGYATHSEGPQHFYGWILKTDHLGNEEWFKTYKYGDYENIGPLHFDELRDLEVMEDGSYVAVGSHLVLEPGEVQHSWLIKLDPCGDIVYNGCPGVDGVENFEYASSQFSCFPNPSNGNFSLDFPQDWQGQFLHVELINGLGQIVMHKTIYSSSEVDVSDLGDGVYQVVLYDADMKLLGVDRLVVE